MSTGGTPPPQNGNGSWDRRWTELLQIGSTPPGDEPGSMLRDLGRNLRATWSGLPRVLELVWSTSRLLTISMGLVSLLQAFMPAAQIYLTKLLVDAVVDAIQSGGASEDVRRIVIVAIAQFLIAAGGSLFTTLMNISQQLLQERVTNRVQLWIMEHASRLDLSFFERSQSYDLLQQAQREAAFRPVMMVSQSFGLMRTFITFTSMIALIMQLEWFLAVAAILAPVPAFVASTRYGWQGFQMMRRQSPARRMMNYLTTLLTTDNHHKESQLYTLGPFLTERYRRLFESYYAANRRLIIRRYLSGFGWGLLTTLTTSATYLYVAWRTVFGALTLGDLTLFTGAATSIQSNFQSLLSGLASMYEHNLYLTTLFELLASEPVIAAPASPTPINRPFHQGIEFRNVSFTYPGTEAKALDDVSFTIQPGESVAIAGSNGAGKSTLVKLLARLYDPDEGVILIDGHDIRDYDPDDLRGEIGALFQDYATYQLTVGENIGLGQVERLEDMPAIETAALRGGADGIIAGLPDQYGTILGRWFDQGQQLSGGQWQKIALARAFMREAQILILDEPTAALDAQAEFELFNRLKELTQGKTTIFISHRFSSIRLADRIFVLEHGRLIEHGTHRELLDLDGRYAELFNLQAASYR